MAARKTIGFLWIILLTFTFSLMSFNTGSVFAQQTKPTTRVKHKPLKFFVPEHRIIVEAEVTDDAGISLVRCYFRVVGEADFVFVELKQGSAYKGILPAPAKETESIEYLFLTVNSKNEIVKTDKFMVNQNLSAAVPAWQQAESAGVIVVSTELGDAPKELAGFKDSIAWDVAESSARFGVVAGGVYAAAGTTSGTAAAATSAGTISAATGISTEAVIGIGAGIGAATLIGVAASDSGGGSVCEKPVVSAGADVIYFGAYLEMSAEGCGPFKWNSSDPSVASISYDPNNSKTARLYAVNVGSVTVTVTDSEGTTSSPRFFEVRPNVVIR